MIRWVRTAALGAAVVWSVGGLVACGGTEPTSTVRSVPAATLAVGRTHAIDGAILMRHDLPPSDVRRQVGYVGGAGPLGCHTPHRMAPRLGLYVRSRAPGSATEAPSNQVKAEVGGELVVCTDGYASKAPVDVTASGPGGRFLRAVAPGSAGTNYSRGAVIELLPGLPPGRYRVVAGQGDRAARASFTLVAADRPALHVIGQPRRGGSALVVAVGLSHDTMVRTYRAEGVSPAGLPQSTYSTSFPARPARDGSSIMRLSIPATMPGGCWWLSVTAQGGTSYDQLCVY